MCLCGMLAAEYQTLPQPMQDSVIGFFDHNETWLEGVLEQGRRDGSLQFAGSARDTARMIVGGLEGAMLVARPYGDIARFQAAAANLLAGLAPAGLWDGPGTPAPARQPKTTVRAPARTTRSSA
jgi:TetR/AcrR family transcriptional regulator, transcriptional repressor for nem operon